MARSRPLGVSLEADDRDFQRTLDQVQRKVRDTAREMEGSLGRALGDTTRDLGKLGDKAPGVASAMLRLEDAQQGYNRALAKHGEESRQARLALARVADQQDRVNQASDRARRSLDRTNDQLERQGMASRAAGAGWRRLKVAAAAGVAAIGYGAVRGINASISAASDLNEELSKSGEVFGDATDLVVRFSETTSDALGISQRAALAATGQFGNMLGPMGIAQDEAAGMSVALVKLAGDAASFNNASPEETLEAFGAALRGEAEPARRFGVFLDAARIKAEAMSSGLVESKKDMVAVREAQVKLDEATQKLTKAKREHGEGSLEAKKAQIAETKATRDLKDELRGHTVELTTAQKTRAAYNIIMQDTKAQQGDAARTGDQLAGLQRRLSASTEDLSAKFGRKLLPTAVKVADYMLRNWPKIESAIDEIGTAAEGLINFISNVFKSDWDAAWRQIVGGVKRVQEPARWAANDLGAAIAEGLWEGFQQRVRSSPSDLWNILPDVLSGPIGYLAPGGRSIGGAINRQRGGSTIRPSSDYANRGIASGGFASGGVIPGRYDARDDITVRVSRGEAVINPLQIALLGGHDNLRRVMAATGGRVGGRAFATGGYVTDAYQRATSNLGEPYGKPSEGMSRTGPNSWDCSGYATMIAGVNIGGTTSSAYGMSSAVPDQGRYPIVWGFRKSHSGAYRGGYDEHMGVRVGGKWFQTSGGRTAQTGSDGSWSEIRVPKGLENLSDSDGLGYSDASRATPPGISANQFRSAIDEARQLGETGQATAPGLTDLPTIDRRHSDDALQERVIRRRGGQDSDVYAFQKREVERDIADVTKRIRNLVKRRDRLVKGTRQLVRLGSKASTSRVTRERLLERFQLMARNLTETRDAIRTLQEMRRELIMDAKLLGFDIQDAKAEEAQEAAETVEEAGDEGLSPGQEDALRNLGEWARSGEAFSRTVSGFGDIGSGGRDALAAAFNPAGMVPITIQAFHPGDPQVLRALSETVTRALGTQGSIPATSLATGA